MNYMGNDDKEKRIGGEIIYFHRRDQGVRNNMIQIEGIRIILKLRETSFPRVGGL